MSAVQTLIRGRTLQYFLVILFIPKIERAYLVYTLNVPIKAKDPPWFAVQMGSVADSVAARIRIIIENTNFSTRKTMQKRIS